MGMDNDKYVQQYRFKVTIDEVEVGEFKEVDGLTVQRDVVEYQEGGENTRHHKLVGPTRYTNIVLRRGAAQNMALFDWVKKTIDGTVERKNGSIMCLDRGGSKVLIRWDFKNAWPCRYQGPDLRTNAADVGIELIELAHDGFEMKSG
jgi:phage tail-like protein